MPESTRQLVKVRTGSHSDVADSREARAYQASLTQRLFCEALFKRLREAGGELRLRNFKEEWLSSDDGLVHELSVECLPVEE